jgi:PEGA domain-containing protein
MRSSAIHRTIAALMAAVLSAAIALPAFAQAAPATAPSSAGAAPATPAPAAAVDPEQSLAQSRELIKAGEYDQAIELLRGTIERAHPSPAALREAYLLLIKTHVFVGNSLKRQPQGRTASELEYDEARRLIGECLGLRELRHTTPEPESEFPPEMVQFFHDVRGRMLGGIRVAGVVPRAAMVTLDGDTLRPASGAQLLEATDVPVGAHLVLVRSPGYVPQTDQVRVSPGSTLELSYTLHRQRTRWWYATRIGAGVVSLGTLVALGYAARSTPGSTAGPGALPGPPPPPSSNH